MGAGQQSDIRRALGFGPGDPTGRGVRVAVIDTGADETHPALRGALHPKLSASVLGGHPVPGLDRVRDRHGHGTAAAGLIGGRGAHLGGRFAGVAPDAELVVVKTSESAEAYSEADVGNALQYSFAADCDLVYCGLGWDGGHKAPPWVWPSGAGLEQLIEADSSGALCFVPCGNEGPRPGTINYPAVLQAVIAVGACELRGVLWGRSSRGPGYLTDVGSGRGPWPRARTAATEVSTVDKPDVITVGVGLPAPLTGSRTDLSERARRECPAGEGLYQLGAGSSEAAAVAAGLAACAIQWIADQQSGLRIPLWFPGERRRRREARGLRLRSAISHAARDDGQFRCLRWPDLLREMQAAPR